MTVRAAPGHLCRLHRLGPITGHDRGLHPSPGPPLYANTHTETSGTGLQTTRFRERLVRSSGEPSEATHDEDAVIFAGSGSTGAVDRLVGRHQDPGKACEMYGLEERIPENERPVVFVGPYEHHSNELPWRESIAEVIEIKEDADGHIDLVGSRRSSSKTPIVP